jgi:hypothetical protein
MVYYFTSKVVEPAGFIYVGKDKFESMIYTQSTFNRAAITVFMRAETG